MSRAGRLGGLLAWLILLAAALIALAAAGRGQLAAPPVTSGGASLRTWVRARDAPTIVIALLRIVAIGLAWYLVATTVTGAVARVTRVAAAVRWADAVTIPVVRRLLGGATGLILTAAPIALTAPQLPLTPGAAAPRLQRLPAGDATAPRLSILPPSETAAPAVPQSAGAPLLTPLPGPPATWTVQPGDSLWRIASRTLESVWGRPATDAEVAPYWEEIIRLNRARLADPDNPDLIYPAQVMSLPPPPAAP